MYLWRATGTLSSRSSGTRCDHLRSSRRSHCLGGGHIYQFHRFLLDPPPL